jgi:thiosulfate dehydrogenase [quinone] large subunit
VLSQIAEFVYAFSMPPEAASAKNSAAIAVLRIGIGILFLIFGEYKVFGSAFVFGGGFQYWINRFLQDGAYPFMVPVLHGFVLPHGRAISLLVAYGETAIGLSLTLGVLTRYASTAGLVYMLTLLFSANYPGAHAPFWQYFGASLEHLVPAICFGTFLLGDPEARFSVRLFFLRRNTAQAAS